SSKDMATGSITRGSAATSWRWKPLLISKVFRALVDSTAGIRGRAFGSSGGSAARLINSENRGAMAAREKRLILRTERSLKAARRFKLFQGARCQSPNRLLTEQRRVQAAQVDNRRLISVPLADSSQSSVASANIS